MNQIGDVAQRVLKRIGDEGMPIFSDRCTSERDTERLKGELPMVIAWYRAANPTAVSITVNTHKVKAYVIQELNPDDPSFKPVLRGLLNVLRDAALQLLQKAMEERIPAHVAFSVQSLDVDEEWVKVGKVILSFIQQVLNSRAPHSFPVYRRDIASHKDAERLLGEDDNLLVLWGENKAGNTCMMAVNCKWIGKVLSQHLPESHPYFAEAQSQIANTCVEHSQSVVRLLMDQHPGCRPSELFVGVHGTPASVLRNPGHA